MFSILIRSGSYLDHRGGNDFVIRRWRGGWRHMLSCRPLFNTNYGTVFCFQETSLSLQPRFRHQTWVVSPTITVFPAVYLATHRIFPSF